MRHISKQFVSDLKKGKDSLKGLLSYIQNDHTLDLELRGNSIEVYYRGGVLLTVSSNVQETDYLWSGLNRNYFTLPKGKSAPYCPIDPKEVQKFEEYIPCAKHVIDYYVINAKKNHLGEKEIQQLVAKENNYYINSQDTDFFVADIEYQDNVGRFDIVAIRWDSTIEARKKDEVQIYIIEVKQGVNAVKTTTTIVNGKKEGNPGLKQHLEDVNKFLLDKDNLDNFREDMLLVFKQKCELRLIQANDKIQALTQDSTLFVKDEVEFVCLLANYKKASSNLKTELNSIDECKFFLSSFMGYGLFANEIIDKQKMLSLL